MLDHQTAVKAGGEGENDSSNQQKTSFDFVWAGNANCTKLKGGQAKWMGKAYHAPNGGASIAELSHV